MRPHTQRRVTRKLSSAPALKATALASAGAPPVVRRARSAPWLTAVAATDDAAARASRRIPLAVRGGNGVVTVVMALVSPGLVRAAVRPVDA